MSSKKQKTKANDNSDSNIAASTLCLELLLAEADEINEVEHEEDGEIWHFKESIDCDSWSKEDGLDGLYGFTVTSLHGESVKALCKFRSEKEVKATIFEKPYTPGHEWDSGEFDYYEDISKSVTGMMPARVSFGPSQSRFHEEAVEREVLRVLCSSATEMQHFALENDDLELFSLMDNDNINALEIERVLFPWEIAANLVNIDEEDASSLLAEGEFLYFIRGFTGTHFYSDSIIAVIFNPKTMKGKILDPDWCS